MSRISKRVKAIADAHIEAKSNDTFVGQDVKNEAELLQSIVDGYTYKQLLALVELHYVTIHTKLFIECYGYAPDSYKKQVYKGFKEILKDFNL
jgi:hypothetical protein